MGFIKDQEERLVIRLLEWQYRRRGLLPPPLSELRRRAGEVIDEAHRIARERGRNVLAILKEELDRIKKEVNR
jgi:hypothetical protein